MKKKILVVDDDKIMLKMLERSLSGNGFSLAQAANGKDAVFLAKTWRPDLIVLDIMMPEMDGCEAAEKLKHNPDTKDIPIIFLTSLLSKEEENESPGCSGQICLAKPFDEHKLLAEIHKHME
ncbi:MAG: PleD family two-component system response regulator [Candidatus Aminicenantaceae bacterium]